MWIWRRRWQIVRKWLEPGIGVKRWLLLLGLGMTAISIGLAQLLVDLYREGALPGVIYLFTLRFLPPFWRVAVALVLGGSALIYAIFELNRSILAPLASRRGDPLIELMQNRSRRLKGLRVVALGGGTGLPAVLRGFKTQTSNITAIVTVADDGGSSGRLRREMGILPPGDLRNNIAALASDEDLMTQIFQYRFAEGGLEGHSLGNLFLTALAAITGSMDQALIEAGKVLYIDGRVLPSTLEDIVLTAEIIDSDGKLRRVVGESQIPEVGGAIQRVFIEPGSARAYPDSIRAILNAELIVVGPGSLFTSILPTLLVNGIAEALRASNALTVYVCNIATQQGETDGFNVGDHVLALERHIGRGVFKIVLANNTFPTQNAGEHTKYVPTAPANHDIRLRYRVVEADLTDPQRPWRHSPTKLYKALQGMTTATNGNGQPSAEGSTTSNTAGK